MKPFFRKRQAEPVVQTVSGSGQAPFWGSLDRYQSAGMERKLYDALRQTVPMIDAALCKIVRLVGGFSVNCENQEIQKQLNYFLQTVQVNACGSGIETFLGIYLEQLLSYGTALGEIVVSRDGAEIAGLYNSSLDQVELRTGESPLELKIYYKDSAGNFLPVARPELIAVSTLSPRPGELFGESILKGLPFVSSILLKIYNTIGLNWERVGNVRFAVTYQPKDGTQKGYTRERAMQIAQEWKKAMKTGSDVSDFVAVGDVKIQTIGADNQILDSQVPVRQMLEQIVAKLSIPPFLLGLSWSTTERMSAQQADILTSELEAYRRLLTPVISKICSLWLRLHGYDKDHTVVWDSINLQDAVELANARLLNAKACQIEETLNSFEQREKIGEGEIQ